MAVLRKSISSPRPPQEYSPESAADDCRKIAHQRQLKLIPLDVFALVSALGLKLVKTPMAENTSGFFQRNGDFYEVGVNSLHHPNRQRFTVAHEIGHYMLHRNHGAFKDGLLFRNNQINHQENEANAFASLLLMPRFEFESAVRSRDLDGVAKQFGVSRQAAQYRMNNLGHIVG